MAWYTTADARRDAERQAALNQQARLLDRPLTSKQVTGLSRAASPSRATDGGNPHTSSQGD